jgi:hypothetical protein
LLAFLFTAVPQPAAAQSCADFAERQIDLSEKQIERNRFSGALRVMNVALENDCRIPMVQNQVADILEAWYEAARASGSTDEMQTVIETVSSQGGLTSEDRSELLGRIRSAIESQITDAFQGDDYRRTYSLCRTYSDYSTRTFSLNYACGRAALEVDALSAGISRYEALLADWSSDQSALTRQEAYQELKELYLITARFDRGFETAKRVAQRDGTPENLLASLTAVRGRFLEPIARVAQAFFDGNVPETARSHVRRELSTVNFPEYVQGIYVMDDSGSPQYAFFGESAVTAPGSDLLARTAGEVSLLLSSGSDGRAWLLSRVDTGYFVVQFNRETTPEENVILEGLVDNVGDEAQWEELYQYEFTSTYPATGSAVATLLGGTYVANGSMAGYGSVFRAVDVLQYFCVQDAQGEIVGDYAFSRDRLQYDDGVWNRTSETPALFHHEVQMGSDVIREVVWPTYRGQEWGGVIRVGIAAES